MCMNCLSFHNDMFLDHHPLSISEAKEEPALLAGGHGLLRSRHKENLKLFCNDHQVLACSSCNCRRSSALSSSDNSRGICLRIKILKRNGYSRPSLYCLEIIIEQSLQQNAYISNQKQEIINTITDCRRQINAHMDEIQNQFLTKLNDTHKEDVDKIGMQIRETRQLQTVVEHSKKMVEAWWRFTGVVHILESKDNNGILTEVYWNV